ncbi:cell wall hydrolase/autolysin [Paenibacillus sp. 32O-W]|uniref:N-acetylmuramoyl-L-alanine amidase family protein n=1 Tax=Paenibacillus sp. 32O-W TaxID=1695218 RepID=UPI000722D99A|nr:N-acetylmuramoyl-L-alanine amidase family protein [Paenibacillus sp. 32O-W]ALS27829.1 cell wall hydrolase/autolysin [Paenibacillus sp. 32O-W]
MKKFVPFLFFLSFLSVLFIGVGQAAADAPKLYLNGKPLESDVEPAVVNQTTLVPIRVIAEGLGFDVIWQKESKKVIVHNGETRIEFTLDDRTALVNGEAKTLLAPATAIKNRTMIPLRFVGENMGLDVYWDQKTKTVQLFQQVKPADPPPAEPPKTETPEIPAKGKLKSIEYNGIGSVILRYEGDVKANKPFVLNAPDRIVLDLPDTAFASDFLPEPPVKGTGGSLTVDGHPTLTKVRYSLYSDKPSTIRVVLDLTAPTNYTFTEGQGELRIDVLDAAGPAPSQPPATEPPATDPSKPPAKKYKVVIDAGHGGHDPGAKSVLGYNEKELNLKIALKLYELLKKEPAIEPYLTRKDDTFVALDDRAKFANDLKADIFISIHGNSFTPSATGTETYYNRSDSKQLAEILHQHVLKATGFKDRGVKTAGYVVIKKTTMPAVLVETGFLSNKDDAAALQKEETQNRIAQELVAGIKKYLKL